MATPQLARDEGLPPDAQSTRVLIACIQVALIAVLATAAAFTHVKH